MSTGQYLLGGAAGLVFGLLVAAGNTLLTRRSLLRAKQNAASVMGTSGLRQVINLAALVLVYLLRGVVPLPLAGTLIGTAVGLSGGSIAGVWILARKMDDTIPAEYRFVKNQAVAKFFGGWCFAVTAVCCVLGMYDKDPFTFALNVITPVVLTVLGFILPALAKREQTAAKK